MNSTKLFQRFLLIVLALFMVLASSCGGGVDNELTEPPTNAPATELPEEAVSETQAPDPCEPTKTEIVNEGYIGDQIVFTGHPEDIQSVVDANSEYFEGQESINTIELQPNGGDFENIDVQLFQLQPTFNVWYVVCELNYYISENITDNEGGIFLASTTVNQNNLSLVFAEPNYITGDPCRGCSGGILGDPASGEPITSDTPGTDFLEQWAFNGSPGINNAGVEYTGQGVEIAVFDTVPSGFSEGINPIGWVSAPFDLNVLKPVLITAPPLPGSASTSVNHLIDLQDHGLFVTGLAHGVAPDASYVLIEALNTEARGNVISLLSVMDEYVVDRRARNETGLLNNTVINLSLGLEIEQTPPTNAANAALDQLRLALERAGWEYSDDLLARLYPSVALKAALTAYEQEGAVIVAAAGNNFGEPPQTPAGFSNVLGVSSNNIVSVLSCFSNEGDVAAPGGEGGTGVDGTPCYMDLTVLCQGIPGGIANCPYAVISLISIPDPGFGYWAGTSMSTPMVSGLAALVLEQCSGFPPADVRYMIENGVTPLNVAGLGTGIINIEQTLAQGCLSSPTPTP